MIAGMGSLYHGRGRRATHGPALHADAKAKAVVLAGLSARWSVTAQVDCSAFTGRDVGWRFRPGGIARGPTHGLSHRRLRRLR